MPYSLNHGSQVTPSGSLSSRRYAGTRLNAARSPSSSRTSTAPASYGTASHLCASTARLSAAAIGASSAAYRGSSTAGAPYAPSTCSQTPCAAQTSATAASGSIAPVFTVPADATTAIGRAPRSRSAASAAASASTGSRRSRSDGSTRSAAAPSPSSSTALATALCAWSDAYTVSGAVAWSSPVSRTVPPVARCRAAASACTVAAEPPLTSRPPQPGRPSSSPSQRTACFSTYVAAWLPPATDGFIAAASASASTATGLGGPLTQPAQRGCPFPSGHGSTVVAISSSSSPAGRPCSGSGAESRARRPAPRGYGRNTGRSGSVVRCSTTRSTTR